MSKINLKEFKSNEDKMVLGELLIKYADIKPATNGTKFLIMILTDGELEIEAKKWNTNEKMFDKGEIIKINGTKNLYNGNVSLIISEMYKGEGELIDFVKHGPNEPIDCYNSIIKLVSSCNHEEMKKLTLSLIQGNEDLFLSVPSAVGHHHAYLGGNCQHTFEVLYDAMSTADFRIKLAKEPIRLYLVCCGAALHDIGKLWCYQMNQLVPEMTTIGKFKDHLVVGSQMLNEKAIELGIDRTQEWFMMIDHIILSHHGKLEWGSPVTPSFPEAFIVHQADLNSTRLVSMQESIDEIIGEWGTKRDYTFGAYLYKGGENNGDEV